MSPEKISRSNIDEVKRRFILENLRFTPKEAAAILKTTVRTFYRLAEEGLVVLVPLRPGQIRGSRVTAYGLEEYRRKVMGELYEPLDLTPYIDKNYKISL